MRMLGWIFLVIIGIAVLGSLATNSARLNTGSDANRGTDCNVKHFTWRNARGGGDFGFIEGVVEAPRGATFIHIQYYDAKDNFLGAESGAIQPGGTFSANINQRNRTSQLKIKYACS